MSDNKQSENIYFAWIKFQRRAVSMESSFNYDCIHITSSLKGKYLKIFDYLVKCLKTLRYLLKYRPRVVWIQLPPTFLLNLLLLYKRNFNKELVIISDCHNGVFFGKWEKYFNPNLLNKSDINIVHNTVIRDIAIGMGLDAEKTIILEDRPADKSVEINTVSHTKYLNQVLMPCGFSKDEPLEVVFEAAKKIPEVTILISGPKERGVSLFDYSKKPENVKLVGYLSLRNYEILFAESDIILGLTTEDHIQISVANEAVGLEKPMVLSNTKLLAEMFDKGAVYVETLSADSIASGIKKALQNIDILKQEITILKKERIYKWDNMALKLKNTIENIENCSN